MGFEPLPVTNIERTRFWSHGSPYLGKVLKPLGHCRGAFDEANSHNFIYLNAFKPPTASFLLMPALIWRRLFCSAYRVYEAMHSSRRLRARRSRTASIRIHRTAAKVRMLQQAVFFRFKILLKERSKDWYRINCTVSTILPQPMFSTCRPTFLVHFCTVLELSKCFFLHLSTYSCISAQGLAFCSKFRFRCNRKTYNQ